MNWYIRSAITLLACSIFTLSAYSAGPIDHFEVTLGKEEAKIWEALDITISAVDKNSEIVTDYTWDILVFSESDPNAEFPNDLAENSYSFTNVNEGSVKFENAIKFTNVGKQDVYVYDLNNENIVGFAEAQLSEAKTEKNVDISILSPENGVTLGKNNITVSGTTRKNHQVRIIINNETDVFTTSNEEGIFEKDIDSLPQGTNTFQAEILNADNEKIGESQKIEIKLDSETPEFKRISITPSGEVEAESEINIEVVSNIGLAEVSVIINDVIARLTETKDGIYTTKTLAPNEAGEYPIDVTLKNEFANETREQGVETLIVIAKPDLKAAWDKETKEKIVENIELTNNGNTPLELAIKNIEVTELKTKSVITWDKAKDAESYNIYKKISDNQIELIEKINEARYEIEIVGDKIRYDDFAIKAVGKTSSGEVVQWDLSEMTRVKTGPELYFLFVILALLASSGVFFFRKNA